MGTGNFVDVPSKTQVDFPGGDTVTLNFLDVELQEFVRVVFDEVLKTTVIVDPTLKGRVTLRSAGPISRAAALDVVRQTLQANGASLSQSGKVYRVTAKGDARVQRQLGDTVRIIPLRYIGAEEARAALTPFQQGGVETSVGGNGTYLIISGAAPDIDNLEQVLSALDVDQMKGMSIALLPLREAGAINVAKEMSQVFSAAGAETRSFRVMPITRMNAVLVVTSRPHLLKRARQWVANFDRADQEGRRIYVYPVQNRRAPDIARILAGMWDKPRDQAQDPPERSVAPTLTPTNTVGRTAARFGDTEPPKSLAQSQPQDFTQQPEQDKKLTGPRINSDASTNAIVAIATPAEWKIIEAALRRLDVGAPQVLIEATIAEVRLNDTLRNGVRWYFESGLHSVALTNSDTGSMASVFPGFNYAFGLPKGRVVLNLLEQVTNVEIVSSPALTVLDNQTAKLQVGDQVPIATRSAVSVITPDAPVVNDIELKDTGVILSVTPRVNASGLVLLDISQEVSDVVPTTTSSLNSPTIRQRRINSTVSVNSGTEIVLGGLIGTSRTRTQEGIPFLTEVPILGELFKSQATRAGDRTELLVILRPTVMGNRQDIVNVTREIKSRMLGRSSAPLP
jgi:general secretion pathway protein D